MIARAGLAAGLLALASHAGGAQVTDTLATGTTRDAAPLACRAAPASDTSRAAPRAERAAVLDTTIVLAITDRTWHAAQYDGGVALGAAASRWNACAGVAVHLGATSVALHNVRGTVHLRADRTALDRAGQGAARPRGPVPIRSTPDSSSTPPAVPPRR